jgi:hypothetical protein
MRHFARIATLVVALCVLVATAIDARGSRPPDDPICPRVEAPPLAP